MRAAGRLDWPEGWEFLAAFFFLLAYGCGPGRTTLGGGDVYMKMAYRARKRR